jgi:hypothetical protein
MPNSDHKKRKQKAKHITARSISLLDSKGKPRILMDAGNGDGYVRICLFGENDRSIQISTSPEGGLNISLLGKRSKVSASLGMNSNENAGLCIRDRKGLLGTMLGSIFETGEHQLVLFREGQQHWSTPHLSKQKKALKKTQSSPTD